MAEHVLGILFVTQSSRGRNVYRYPSDPFAPHTRLSQPIYPSATFTAKEAAFSAARPTTLFPPVQQPSKRSSVASAPSPGKEGANKPWVHPWATADEGEDVVRIDDDSVSSDQSSVSSDNDLGQYVQSAAKHVDADARPNGRKTHSDAGSSKYTSSRRGSLGPDLVGLGPFGLSSLTHSSQVDPSKHDRVTAFVESQYDHALSYHLDFLADMLTPPRSACNKKFEVTVDELMFIGHPVTNNAEGKWAFPDEDEGIRPSARGRRRGRDEKPNLGTVPEDKESEHDDDQGAAAAVAAAAQNGNKQEPQGRTSEDGGAPLLSMFHLAVIIDRPDPKSVGAEHDIVANHWADEIYHEIAFKWTAAAFALQVKENWIAKQTNEMQRIKERCVAEGIPIYECCEEMYAKCPLDRSLNSLFSAIHQARTKPPNPLYAYLPSTFTVNLANLPIDIVLSPKSQGDEDEWMRWEEDEASLSVSDDDDSDAGGWNAAWKASDFRVEPWQTLLLVDENTADDADEISKQLVGLAAGGTDTEDSVTGSPVLGTARRDSKELTSAEEDEGLLMKALIEACNVTKRLVDIAHALRYDLEGIVMPLARELVQNKKAILIDVVNTRLRSVVAPTDIEEHGSTIDAYALEYAQRFPDLPEFVAMVAMLSAAPVQFKELLPPGAPSDISIRQTYMDALVWMLRKDLVVQLHTRVRVLARAEVKEVAWRRLWTRRRERWLSRRQKLAQLKKQQPPRGSISSSSDGSPLSKTDIVSQRSDDDLETPRVAKENPLDPFGYDSDFAPDSDENEDDDGTPEFIDMGFSVDEAEPKNIPSFEASFIFRPGRAQKDEMRWLRVIREAVDDVWASKFDLCVQFFDGVATFEEISYHTGMQRRELERMVQLFPDDLITLQHP